MNAESIIDMEDATSLKTLLEEIKRHNLSHMANIIHNFILLVKLQLIFAPTSAEAGRSFSKIKLIKTILRNIMLCKYHRKILDNIYTIALLNKFVKKKSHVVKRKTFW